MTFYGIYLLYPQDAVQHIRLLKIYTEWFLKNEYFNICIKRFHVKLYAEHQGITTGELEIPP